ncbi:hypothetical protein BSKO_01038 [Bryopsis sp. KO-2023]|nr:hypothetical protein BSKO_01038 [Bryopsis sp. KO-2023]
MLTGVTSAPESALITSEDGVVLEAKVFRSSGRRHDPHLPAIVIVHQYSVLGGSQDLMRGIAQRLAAQGHVCVTFNMRGVGASTGAATITGESEVKDVIAACEWTKSSTKREYLILVGSSAGAPIAGSAVDQVTGAVGYVGIGYTFGCLTSIIFGRHYRRILDSRKPKLFIMGSRDGFTSVRQLRQRVARAQEPCSLHIIEGPGHFALEGSDYDRLIAGLIHEFVFGIAK